ncbi:MULTISPECIES: sensor histidine kinase [Actinomycetes]|uniref:Histidine kinase n=1 Tax=Streptomyces tendae TaxID=1932 RepID=A0A6B3QU11_STRTE|nr:MULTISPECIES: histidine kinase [unclassified Streptomyces]MBQ0968621.1 histidine kinase [Streptomyces sp. RK74B]MBQ1008706.1 histidine kinase [Streptomyces sp. RK23]MZG15425.1 histidine kinase [Streptomyces sp. SID5914]NEV89925.1 histidine kinase [Streptomyces tendae]
MALKIARSLIVAVVLSSGVLALADMVASAAEAGEIFTYVLCATPLLGFQAILPFLPCRHWNPVRKAFLILLIAAATYPCVALGGANWNGLTGPLAGSALLLLTGIRAWVAFALVVADAPVRAAVQGAPLLPSIGSALAVGLCGLLVLGLARLTHLVSEAWASRAEVVRRAVVRERLRFSMDLHDLLGYSLSSIALKSELIYRLVPSRPDQARKEIDEVLDISRQALSDVRLVARRYRGMSLESEVSSVESVLNSLGVVALVDIRCGNLPPAVDTVLATAVREGVTNALRHAHVNHVMIRAVGDQGKVRLLVANDGVVEGAPAQRCPDGSGLHNLASRFDVVGGRIDAEVTDDGWFHLVGEVPRSVTLEPVRPAC